MLSLKEEFPGGISDSLGFDGAFKQVLGYNYQLEKYFSKELMEYLSSQFYHLCKVSIGHRRPSSDSPHNLEWIPKFIIEWKTSFPVDLSLLDSSITSRRHLEGSGGGGRIPWPVGGGREEVREEEVREAHIPLPLDEIEGREGGEREGEMESDEKERERESVRIVRGNAKGKINPLELVGIALTDVKELVDYLLQEFLADDGSLSLPL